MKYTKVNNEIGVYIMEAVNAGICADTEQMLDYSNEETHNYVYTSTNGYDLTDTILFITGSIREYNAASKRHSVRK